MGFFADGKLRKIDTRGGSPIALAEAYDGYGGSWSTKGTIVFAPTVFAPLMKVPADGGNTIPAIAIDTGGHGFPWFLPDAEHFLYVSWAGRGRLEVRLGSLSSPANTVVADADSNAAYADGRLIYLRGASLMAQPFNVKSLRTDGDAVPIAEGVERFMDLVSAGSYSVSSGLLAYRTGSGGGLRQLTWFDRMGRRLGIVGSPRAFFRLEFAPGGKTFAVAAPDDLGKFDIWTYDVAQGVPARLTSDPAGAYYAVWSPDGRSVIFNSTRKGHYDLYRKPAEGAGPEELVYADEMDKVPISWSRDGRFLLYFTGGGPRHELWVLALSPARPGEALKATPFLKTGFNEVFPRFSPDGQWVAWSSNESGRNEIYAAPFARPSEKHQVSRDGGYFPRWREDGKEIFFVSPNWELLAAEIHVSGSGIDIKAAHPLLSGIAAVPGSAEPYDVAENGQRILAMMPAGDRKAPEPLTLIQNWSALLTRVLTK